MCQKWKTKQNLMLKYFSTFFSKMILYSLYYFSNSYLNQTPKLKKTAALSCEIVILVAN